MNFNSWIIIAALSIFIGLFVTGCSKSYAQGTLALSGENGKWNLFVPPESSTAGCRFKVSTDTGKSGLPIISMSSVSLARYALRQNSGSFAVVAGQRYRLSARVRAGANFKHHESSPGIILRGTLFTAPGVDYDKGHYCLSAGGSTLGAPERLGPSPVPLDWTPITGVVEIPAGVTQLKFFVFSWWTTGEVLIDDPKVELVPSNTLLSPLR